MPAEKNEEAPAASTAEHFERLFEDGKYSSAQRQSIIRRIRNGLNDSEWLKLQRSHRLPSRARSDVRHLIASYWDYRTDIKVAKTLPARIEGAIRELKKNRDALIRLVNHPDFFKGVFAYYHPSPLQQASALEETIGTLGRAELLLENALVRIKGPAWRRPHRGIWLTIGIVEGFMKFNWRMKELAHESLILDIIELADPLVTVREFKSVFKEFAAVRPLWNGTRDWLDHQFR